MGPFIADSEKIARELIVAASCCLLRDPDCKTAFIDTPESKFTDPGVYVERAFDQAKKPSGHRLIKTARPVRDFTRMYQLVDYAQADKLAEQFSQAEKLGKFSERVTSFRETMHRAVLNYTETASFMAFERDKLQEKFWGISGPEKG